MCESASVRHNVCVCGREREEKRKWMKWQILSVNPSVHWRVVAIIQSIQMHSTCHAFYWYSIFFPLLENKKKRWRSRNDESGIIKATIIRHSVNINHQKKRHQVHSFNETGIDAKTIGQPVSCFFPKIKEKKPEQFVFCCFLLKQFAMINYGYWTSINTDWQMFFICLLFFAQSENYKNFFP